MNKQEKIIKKIIKKNPVTMGILEKTGKIELIKNLIAVCVKTTLKEVENE